MQYGFLPWIVHDNVSRCELWFVVGFEWLVLFRLKELSFVVVVVVVITVFYYSASWLGGGCLLLGSLC